MIRRAWEVEQHTWQAPRNVIPNASTRRTITKGFQVMVPNPNQAPGQPLNPNGAFILLKMSPLILLTPFTDHADSMEAPRGCIELCHAKLREVVQVCHWGCSSNARRSTPRD